MSANELREHVGYLADEHKLAGYEAALRGVLGDRGAVVLDLGAGSGILGLLAARAGARRVYAVDSGPVIGPAADVAAGSGLGDRFVHLRASSTEVSLPEPVDLAVCDQIGGFVHDAGVLEYFADVRARLLAPDGRLMPQGFRLYLAPAACGRVRDELEIWRSAPAGFDFGAFHHLAVNTEHRVDGHEVDLLGPGVEVAHIEADHLATIAGSGEATVAVAGRFDGLVGWFQADLGAGVTVTNAPASRDRMRRWCNFYPVTDPVPAVAGDVVEVTVDVRPVLSAVSWSVLLRRDDATVAHERHSTLLGRFIDGETLARTGGAALETTPLGSQVVTALQLADGTRSTEEILDAVGTVEAAHGVSGREELRVALLRYARATAVR